MSRALAIALAGLALAPARAFADDLDGDGTPDTVLERKEAGACGVTVGTAQWMAPEAGFETCAVRVVDLDAADPTREVLVEAIGRGDHRGYWLLRLTAGKLVALGGITGALPTPPDIIGNGFVMLDRWMGFFAMRIKLELGTDGKLREVVPELYAVGINALKVRKSFPLIAVRGRPEVMARLRAGSEINVVAYDPSPACAPAPGDPVEPCDLFLVRASSGVLGWARHSDLAASTRLPRLPPSS